MAMAMRLIFFTCFVLCVTQCNASTITRDEVDTTDERYFCNEECDVERARCSCMKTCKEEKNCCTDYVETCEGGSSWTDTVCTPVADMKCPDGYTNPHPVILLSIDGFRNIYINRGLTPTIQKLAECGVTAPYMLSEYPTKTFPNHYSIVTGLYPESHGIIANKMYNHEREEEFRLGRESSFNPEWWKGEPIWVSTSNQGLKSAAYFWPGSDVNITRYPDYWYKYNETKEHGERVYQMLDWLDLPQEDRPSLIVLYTHIVDTAGHTFGPYGQRLDDSLKAADDFVEMMMNGLRDRGLDTCVNFMITSDHGMASMDCLRNVNYLDDYGVNISEVYLDTGPFARIGKNTDKSLWDKFDAVETKKKLECKRNETHWEAFLKYEYLPKRYHYANDPAIEDLHLVMDQEYWVDGTASNGPGCSPGEHGFDNLYDDMRAFFVGHGPGLKRGYNRSEPFENIELYNLYADLLGIDPAPNNGTRGSLFDFFSTPPTLEKEDVGVTSGECPFDANQNADNLGCEGCEDVSNDEADKNLDLTSSEVTDLQDLHWLYGQPRVLDTEADYCVLTQRGYINIYDKTLKMPRVTSFVLSKENKWVNSPLCVRRDVRLTDDSVTRCDSYDEASWTFLFSPNLTFDDARSDATISSNVVPIYPAFADVWTRMQVILNYFANTYNGITVHVGPIFDYDYDGNADSQEVRKNNGSFVVNDAAPIPTHFFIVMTRCKDRSSGQSITQCSSDVNDIEVLSFIVPNYKEAPCHENGEPPEIWVPRSLIRHVARIKDVELLTKLSFFSKWVAADESTTEDHLQTIKRKLFLPQESYDWLEDFADPIFLGASTNGISWICFVSTLIFSTFFAKISH